MKLFKNGLVGAISGLAGAYAMQRFRSVWNAKLSAADGVFGLDDEADLNSVRRLLPDTYGRTLTREQALRIALLLHYGYGAMAGAGYGIAARKFPSLRAGHGTAFGITLWAIGDELAMSVSGLSDPRRKSSLSHASALFAHLLFGTTVEVILSRANRLLA
ncbi:MAG: DUF1440 domain-containing protein [Acidobacteriota bacterium]|nr:DUF1440 domain-containing protein [Acidobacteriota bacterium]